MDQMMEIESEARAGPAQSPADLTAATTLDYRPQTDEPLQSRVQDDFPQPQTEAASTQSLLSTCTKGQGAIQDQSAHLQGPMLTGALAENPAEPFNIFDALCRHTALFLEFAKQLDIEDLVSLYAISRNFHTLLNARFTTTMLAQALRKAPESSRTFKFKAYKSLCMHDPAKRPHPRIPNESRMIPSFRWLRMVLFRERVVTDIIALLATEGHRLPPRASLTIKRLWLLMDIATNEKRVGLLHNDGFFTNDDLYLATMFFIKLDMRFMDPIDGVGETAMRRLMLGQRSLSTLWRCLRRKCALSRLEMLQLHVRYSYQPRAEDRAFSIMGVPANEVGRGSTEGWGQGQRKLLRPDELVMMEDLRRGLNLVNSHIYMMLWGYVDTKTFEDLEVPEEEKYHGSDAEEEEAEAEAESGHTTTHSRIWEAE
ncbi:MAG: hypothetical protein M1817_000574 [Caeruleum heppii]|nr:MAG: hypothetical protein M1817_000574 [Caeruleum heppii]